MPRSPYSPAQSARERVAALLSELRKDAGITGYELSLRCGWSGAKVSRIENAKTTPSDTDIRDWCSACGHPERAEDLISASRQADQLYVEWRRQQRTGMRRVQDNLLDLGRRTRLQRVYCSNVIPGFFQTPDYSRALLTSIIRFEDVPNDIDAAVTARARRAQLLHEAGRRFVVLLEESVLRYRIGGPQVMARQLEYLAEVAALPSVALGIIPFTADRDPMWPLEAFYIHDHSKVIVETLTAEINVTAASEMQMYERAFIDLGRLAVYGPTARWHIAQAVDALH